MPRPPINPYSIAFIIVITVLAACSPPPVTVVTAQPTVTAVSPTATQTPTVTPTPVPTSTSAPTNTPPTPVNFGPDNTPVGINPLTGLPVDNPAILDRRPLLIKISNAPPVVRPQSGLSYADIIVEEYVEGGWTRFAALFYSHGIDHVGSVRSVRLVDFQLADAFDALLVFSGGSQGVIELLRREPLYPYNTISPQFGVGQPYFVRFPREGVDFEHTLFTDTALLWQWADDFNVRTTPFFLDQPGLSFQDVPPTKGDPASHVIISYARTTADWQYDPSSGQYLRWTDDVPHTDALTGQQLAFANVVVISAYHEEINILPEMFFGQEKSLYIELSGSGPATIFRNGLTYQGQWQRDTGKSLLTFVDPFDQPLYLKPGTTFIHIVRAGFETLTILP